VKTPLDLLTIRYSTGVWLRNNWKNKRKLMIILLQIPTFHIQTSVCTTHTYMDWDINEEFSLLHYIL